MSHLTCSVTVRSLCACGSGLRSRVLEQTSPLWSLLGQNNNRFWPRESNSMVRRIIPCFMTRIAPSLWALAHYSLATTKPTPNKSTPWFMLMPSSLITTWSTGPWQHQWPLRPSITQPSLYQLERNICNVYATLRLRRQVARACSLRGGLRAATPYCFSAFCDHSGHQQRSDI